MTHQAATPITPPADPEPIWTEHYQPGVPAEIELPEKTLVEMFAYSVRHGGDLPALTFFGKTMTYRQLGDKVARVANALRQRGVRRGDRVALILPNCPQHVVAYYAVLRLGAIVVEHNPLYTRRELAGMFADHGAKIAIAWDKAVEKIQHEEFQLDHLIAVNLLSEFPLVKRFALSLPIPKIKEARAALTAKVSDVEAFAELEKADPLEASFPGPGLHDLATIQYTSGTTGEPKGAMLTHFNMHANALEGKAWQHGTEEGKETFYAVLPMFHAFGMTLYLSFGIMLRAHLVLFPKFDADMLLDEVKKYPPTVFHAVPPIYQRLAERAQERGVPLTSIKYCISGAMKLTDDIVEQWEAISGGLLVEGYGMTEAAPVLLGNPFYPTRRTGTIGIPFPNTLRVVMALDDPNRQVEVGEPGELWVKGPQIFQGYWNNPEATKKTLLPGGWLRTGDIVTLDEDGFATIVDRAKEMINTGGFNVSPTEVEHVLVKHPAVAQTSVVGYIDPQGMEKVVAAVVLADGATIDREEMRAFCKQSLAAYKVPREFVAVSELPTTMLGKTLRKKVLEEISPELDRRFREKHG